jgi:hypothetical protein
MTKAMAHPRFILRRWRKWTTWFKAVATIAAQTQSVIAERVRTMKKASATVAATAKQTVNAVLSVTCEGCEPAPDIGPRVVCPSSRSKSLRPEKRRNPGSRHLRFDGDFAWYQLVAGCTLGPGEAGGTEEMRPPTAGIRRSATVATQLKAVAPRKTSVPFTAPGTVALSSANCSQLTKT